MPRNKGMDGAYTHIRADLETVLAALADHNECSPRVHLRIRQAIRRAELGPLLEPALEDLERMIHDVADARAQVLSAVDRLLK